ncbi:Uncharacterised protein [Mycoplasmopsis synoviae]|uniref:Uncharacterized protein n=1 Tax=Mycoplasmopsis synoviae TaxID=2109 RepID=A0A3B0PN59_MYCSY|nr:Uncharacterised protein [Mycoplasmopsis synoviae]
MILKSFEYSSLMSLKPYLIMAILSRPIPAAKADSLLQFFLFFKILGCNIPAPSISIHLFL